MIKYFFLFNITNTLVIYFKHIYDIDAVWFQVLSQFIYHQDSKSAKTQKPTIGFWVFAKYNGRGQVF